MKVIREIKPVSVCTEYDSVSENNNDLTLDILDSEPGFYEQVIRPMLKKGHEGELVNWLKSSGLIPQFQKCKNAENNDNCKKPLSWYSSRTMDQYQWKCLNCSRKYSIRENSVFHDVRCNIKDVLRLILGWCKGNDVDTMCKVLNVRKQIANSVYRICANIALKYIETHLFEWKIGGSDCLVVIDIYPDGCKKFDVEHFESIPRTNFPILCLAEIKPGKIPPRYWFEILNKNQLKTQQEQRQAGLAIIERMVVPGSSLITNLDSSVCNFYDLQQNLKHIYPNIVSVDGLTRHNNETQNALTNLGEVWKDALNICDYVQSHSLVEVQQNLANVLWERKFGNEGFQILLHQMGCGET